MSQFRGIHVGMAPLPEALREAGILKSAESGWYVVTGWQRGSIQERPRAHYFRAAPPKDPGPYAPALELRHSLCGGVPPDLAGSRWTAHDHAGRVRMCKTCRSRLERPRR